MNVKAVTELLVDLYKKWSGTEPEDMILLPQSGSYRQYYRIKGPKSTVMGTYNEDKKENLAFIKLSRHFHEKGLKVVEIYLEDIENNIYLQEDLGDEILLERVAYLRKNGDMKSLVSLYKQILEDLSDFQTKGRENLDFELCYPRSAFDKQSILWDLNYFKYSFLKIVKVPFDEQLLENDFQKFADYLLETDCSYFLYRDFQSRNIMMKNNDPYYIDYQGGRKGALQYDVASLLFESKIDLPFDMREDLLKHYAMIISQKSGINEKEFLDYYYPYVLIRLMQAMGAYGFRGLIERKKLFIQSIPHAIKNLKWILQNVELKIELPALKQIFEHLTHEDFMKKIPGIISKLRIHINSFSYKRGIPADLSGHGGGFVFDCRGIENPGRQQRFKDLTGRDRDVCQFIEEKTGMNTFLEHIFHIIDQTVENYTNRKFNHLSINFGCTGGQHRSVYSAEKLKQHILDRFNENDVEIVLQHLELKVREELNVWKE